MWKHVTVHTNFKLVYKHVRGLWQQYHVLLQRAKCRYRTWHSNNSSLMILFWNEHLLITKDYWNEPVLTSILGLGSMKFSASDIQSEFPRHVNQIDCFFTCRSFKVLSLEVEQQRLLYERLANWPLGLVSKDKEFVDISTACLMWVWVKEILWDWLTTLAIHNTWPVKINSLL